MLPSLFIIAVEMLSIFIKNSNVALLDDIGMPIIISQLADYTTIFMKHIIEIPNILKLVDIFSKASGLKLSLNMCELMSIRPIHLTEGFGIPIKSTVKYLGTHIANDSAERESMNIWKIIDNWQSRFNSWL